MTALVLNSTSSAHFDIAEKASYPAIRELLLALKVSNLVICSDHQLTSQFPYIYNQKHTICFQYVLENNILLLSDTVHLGLDPVSLIRNFKLIRIIINIIKIDSKNSKYLQL